MNCLLNESEITIIDNSNITLNHLNRSGLHLNKRGDGALALNIINFIKALHCKCSVQLAEPLENEISTDDHDKNRLDELQKINLKHGFKVISLNINSLYKHLDELRLFCAEHNPHIISLNETKINDEISDEFLRIDGFPNIIRKDRTRYGRGVAVYVKNGIKFSERSDPDSDLESVSIELKINYSKPFIVTTIYKLESKVEIYEKIESLICKIDTEDKECILTGDMNHNMLNPQDNNTRHIKRIYNTCEFKQIIKEATRTTSDTKSLIDHIAINRPERIASGGVIPCGISDHDVVYAVRTMRIPRVRAISKMVAVRKFKNFDLLAFRSELSKINFDRIETIISNPNEMWLLWRTFFWMFSINMLQLVILKSRVIIYQTLQPKSGNLQGSEIF